LTSSVSVGSASLELPPSQDTTPLIMIFPDDPGEVPTIPEEEIPLALADPTLKAIEPEKNFEID
jgi:hypothetical protein